VLGLLREVLGQTEAQIQAPDMVEQTQGPVPTPAAIAASPGSRSPAEVSTVAVTATKSAPPDSVLTKPAATPPANGQLRSRRLPAAPSSSFSQTGIYATGL
jgi:hypothetical protein